MSERRVIAICGWCPTELPSTDDLVSDLGEAQHHFFVAHNQSASRSIRYVYPDDIESEFAAFAARPVAGSGTGERG